MHRTFAVALALLSLASQAEGEAVDPEVALPILLRVLTYDKSFKSHGEGEFVVLVPADAPNASSRDRLVSVARALKLSSIQSRPLRYVPVDTTDVEGLSRAVAQIKPSAILIPSGVSPATLSAVRRVAAQEHLYSLSLDASAVEQKVALLAVASHDGKPQIVLNIEAARGLNASFDNAVLRLAKLVQ